MWIIGSKVVFIEITVNYDETTERWARRSQACNQSADRRQITEIKRDAGADYRNRRSLARRTICGSRRLSGGRILQREAKPLLGGGGGCGASASTRSRIPRMAIKAEIYGRLYWLHSICPSTNRSALLAGGERARARFIQLYNSRI